MAGYLTDIQIHWSEIVENLFFIPETAHPMPHSKLQPIQSVREQLKKKPKRLTSLWMLY